MSEIPAYCGSLAHREAPAILRGGSAGCRAGSIAEDVVCTGDGSSVCDTLTLNISGDDDSLPRWAVSHALVQSEDSVPAAIIAAPVCQPLHTMQGEWRP